MGGKHSVENDVPKALRNNNQIEYAYVNNRTSQGGKTKKKRKALKIFGIFLLILIILFAGVVGGGYWYLNDKLGKMQQVEIDEDELDISEQAKQNLTGFRNIALFGVDSRENDLGKGNRSDCIIIASINNKTSEVKLLSVYRDTYLQIEGQGLDKVTHAYSYGEAPLAISTLNTNLDLNIKEFVTVNFDVLADAVNALGGITINIESSEIKYINDYIDATSKSTGIKSSHITKTGNQTLDGVQAVAYSRIRYTSGGDYKRTERMRDVLTAMIQKVKTKSIGEINKLADEILPKLYTNISAGDIFAMLPNIMNYNITDSIGWPYETKGITLDRWYGVPVNLANNVSKLHKDLFGEENYTPSSTVQDISNKIISKTGYR